jgi:hypothetical protein
MRSPDLAMWLAVATMSTACAARGSSHAANQPSSERTKTGDDWRPDRALDPAPAPPTGTDGDPHPETCNVVGSHVDGGDYEQVDATCFLHANLGTVWQALQDPNVTADPSTTSIDRVPQHDTDAARPMHELDQYTASEFISVNYTLEWVHMLLGGTLAAPTHVLVSYRKTSGTRFIHHLEGDYDLTSPAPGVTRLVICVHVSATQTNTDDVKKSVERDVEALRKATASTAQ